MIILGLDPGSRMTGYGLVAKQGKNCVHIENGTLYVADAEPDYPKRLAYLHSRIEELIKKYNVSEVAVENIFYHKNVKSSQKLGEVRGVLMASAALHGAVVAEYTALQVKQAVTGYGKASKEQVQLMVRTLLKLKDLPEENAADALAIALCHGHQNVILHLAKNAAQSLTSSKTDNRELLKKASFYR